MESSFTTASFSIETLMDEIKPIVMEKYELDYTDESTLIALFEFWDPKKILTPGSKWNKFLSERTKTHLQQHANVYYM